MTFDKSAITEEEIKWVVNSFGELGVEIGGRYFFCYKGESFEYKESTHMDGSPIMVRGVGKREFGETIWPVSWVREGRKTDKYEEGVRLPSVPGSNSNDEQWEWKELPLRGDCESESKEPLQ